MLLKAAEGMSDEQIVQAVGTSISTVLRTRKRFVEEGLDALNERPRSGQPRKFDGKQEAHMIAVVCSEPPDGHTRWTLRLLAGKVVELGLAESVSLETVRKTLKKTNLSLGGKSSGASPSAEYVACMEDVLDLYEEPYDPKRPMICMDETSKQLVLETRLPMPTIPGYPGRYDFEYQRNGTRNLFMFCEPLRGFRHVEVTERRTAQDFAQQMKWLVDDAYPEADVVCVVLDNLNTHKVASLYKAFEPAEARRIARRLEFHFTPKHGSWLNMAEIEFSVLSRQCLNRRIPDEQTLKREVAAHEKARNRVKAMINWQFTSIDARTKLEHIYPS